MTVGESEVFRFADIEVRAGEFLVLKGGKPLSVEPKAFRVLLPLQRNHGRLVKKEALLDAIWEDLNVTLELSYEEHRDIATPARR